MSEGLKNFLSEIAVDAAKLGRYLENPDAAMKEAGLDADECAALKSGDPARVYASLSGQAAPPQPASQRSSPPANIICGASPQASIVYGAPQPNIIYAAQPQANIIYAPPQANIIYSAQPQANILYAGQPQAAIIYAAPQANIIYATQPQASIIYGAQPQPNIIYATRPQQDVEQPTSQPPQAKGAAAGS
jgi:hypothetical protein